MSNTKYLKKNYENDQFYHSPLFLATKKLRDGSHWESKRELVIWKNRKKDEKLLWMKIWTLFGKWTNCVSTLSLWFCLTVISWYRHHSVDLQLILINYILRSIIFQKAVILCKSYAKTLKMKHDPSETFYMSSHP